MLGEIFASILWCALTIALAAPLVPFAVALARRSLRSWGRSALAVGLTGLLLHVTFFPASPFGIRIALPIVSTVVLPLLGAGGSTIGQGAIAFLFIWTGVWAVAMFMVACMAVALLNAGRRRLTG
jgi:hypothetical protein